MSRLRCLAVVVTCLAGCRDELSFYEGQGPRYEARGWLAATVNPYPFASNRFASKQEAGAFVDSLYTSGADTVYVLNVQQDSAWIAQEGGPYADALLIKLPTDAAARSEIFEINAQEARREGFDPEGDRGRRYLYFWWD